jgi:hypothetical protein
MKSSTPLGGNNNRPLSSLESGDRLMAAAAGAVAKSIFYICLTVTAGFYISSCNLDSSTIEQCQQSCTDIGTRMESVTPSKCVCMQAGLESKNDDIWVLPQ